MVKYAHEPDNATKAVKVGPLPDLQQAIIELRRSFSAFPGRQLN